MIIEETKINILEQVFTKINPIKNKNEKKQIKLIVGLGNPEKKYDNTYHNMGFIFVDYLAKKFNINIKKKECKSITGELFIEDEKTTIDQKTGKLKTNKNIKKIIIAKPQTYMNLSGEAVISLIKKYKFSLEEILIVLDDIDIDLGTYRYRENGSAGTHNGLRSIVNVLKSTNFKRLRIGIGKDKNLELADYVLSKISKENMEKIEQAINRASEYIIDLIS